MIRSKADQVREALLYISDEINPSDPMREAMRHLAAIITDDRAAQLMRMLKR